MSIFTFSEEDLYDRIGYKEPINKNKVNMTTSSMFTNVDGQKIPTLYYPIDKNGLRRNLVLKTLFGYIPVDKISSYKDLFIFSNYLNDETEWEIPYEDFNEEKKEKVRKLAIDLGKHWKNK